MFSTVKKNFLYNSKFEKYFLYYLIILFGFSIFYLTKKHDVGNDSTIAEWIINYSGGFTKRGIVGHIAILISEMSRANLRDVILFLQITTLAFYYILLFIFFKNIKINKVLILSIFTPIFILYPVAEIEVLARKEVFIFIFFITYILIENLLIRRIYQIFVISLAVLIWEPVVFYFLFFLAIDIFKYKFEKFDKKFFVNLFFYVPSILVALFIALNPIEPENHMIMENYLKINFNENCYTACALLKTKSSIYDQFESNFHAYSFTVFFRYFLIIFFGFGPIIILTKKSSVILKNLIFFKYFKNLLSPLMLMLTPVIILFAMGADWGRWVNISYVFTIIFYIYLLKKKYIYLNEEFLNKKFFNPLNKKSIFILIIVFYCFGWNPKTVITGDVATNPGWKIPYNASKDLFNFKNFRLFQDSPLIKWHRKYIE